MYLKGMQIQGFKSFADKISLEFMGGITSVIGPNGSGKSNIADAVRWVLGEQSAKTLRGGKMEDVIFAGTEHRKPMGFSEVSLTIDNSDLKLPVDYSEVTVTRRLYRSGESEYMINKTSCRLKDIHELFMDTGLGKDGYSIIGQGRVDEILSTKSEDRRHIFEEASGIMKFKVRKQEAEKKLELTKQNIYRINDIISELETQIEPLRIQSESAKKYLTLREELKEIEVNVFLENISNYKVQIKDLDDKYIIVKDNVDAENYKLELLNQRSKELSEGLKVLEVELDDTRKNYYENESQTEKFNSQLSFNKQRAQMLQENLEKLDSETEQLDKKLEAIKNEEALKQKKLEYLKRQKADFSIKLQEFEKQLETLMQQLGESERQIELIKAEIMDKLDILSDKKSQINSQKHHLESIKARCNHIDNELYHLRLDKDKENMKKEEVVSLHRRVLSNIKSSEDRETGLQTEKKELLRSKEENNQKLNGIRSKAQMLSSKHKALQDMEKNLDGYSRSVKELLLACKNSPSTLGKGVYGAIAQLISVEKKYETAIEMALGGALQNVVTETEEDAKRAIEYLKVNKAGRATFLPISSVNGRKIEENTINTLSGISGFCGIASDLVGIDNKFKNIILSLLGRVVIVENLEEGIKIARRFNYSFRIVTLGGDILNTGGSMSGGSTDQRNGGILSRHREISNLKDEIDILNSEDIILSEKISSIDKMVKEVEQELNEEYERTRGLQMEKIQEEGKLRQIEDEIKRIETRIQFLIDEKKQHETELNNQDVILQKLFDEQKSLEEQIANAKEQVSKFQELHKENQTERDNLHLDITDYRVSVNSIEESLNQAEESLQKLKLEQQDFISNALNRERDKEKYKNEIALIDTKNSEIASTIETLSSQKNIISQQLEKCASERKLKEELVEATNNEITQKNSSIALLREDMGRIEIKKAKVESDLETIQNKLWEEYELTYTNALKYKKDIESMAGSQREINELKNKIRNLGAVNVSAIEEYVKVKERYDFMSVQRADMEQAEAKLQKIILEITGQMKQQFIEQFRLINTNFCQVFRELFDGGRAELILLDEQNVLESGIEIEVQPPGKKLQNMMLLSGGERAFTAIALLFAILKLRPTPFCILDEIEAALDDANVHRFARYLKEFSKDTQFVVVTHRKGTMESSDCLYGVTMQEHGISKVVSLKLNEAS